MPARSEDSPAAGETPTLQARLEDADHRRPPPREPGAAEAGGSQGEPIVLDPAGLFRQLETGGRFHRDTGLGRLFHPGCVSLRENVATDSLHLVIHGNRVAAHVDRVSPLHLRPQEVAGYSLRRAAAHNLVGMAQDVARLLRGRQGDHRSQLDCRWVWNADRRVADPIDLLDPTHSAWSVQLEARVRGHLDESRLRQAMAQVVGTRPAEHRVLEVIDAPDDGRLDNARAQLHASPVPVADWPPLRALLARHPGGDVLMLNVNHAASDGIGALRILRSIAQVYADPTGGHPALEFLAVNDLPVLPASAPVSRVMAWNRVVVERLRDLLTRPARLAPDDAGDQAGYGFHLVCLSAEKTRLMIDPDRPGTSRNVLLAGLHRAIGEWNQQHGTPGHRIGVLVQVNLRSPHWRDDTVANFSVTARVSTSPRHRADPAQALQAISAQTARNKRTRSGIALLEGLDRSGLLPLWARQSLIVLQPLTRNRLIDAAMLSHLGALDEPPSFGPDAGETVEVWFSAPTRAPLSLSVGAVSVSGRLHLVFRYPRRVLGADAVRRFADSYLAQVFQAAGARA